MAIAIHKPHDHAFKCIHNDRHPGEKSKNFTMRGMFAAVIWIALWSLIITAVATDGLAERKRQVAAYWQGRHQWNTAFSPGATVAHITTCSKCGLDVTRPGSDMNSRCPK